MFFLYLFFFYYYLKARADKHKSPQVEIGELKTALGVKPTGEQVNQYLVSKWLLSDSHLR